MVAFLASVIVTLIQIAIIVVVAKRRAPGTPMTWGEGYLAATFVFAWMLMVYGIVPNQWLAWADNELGWRSDSIGVPTPFGRLWPDGVTFFGRGRLEITAQVIRDLIATLIYIVAFVGQIVGWLWWQKRGKKTAPPPAIETSAFGRPLVRKV
ncbi:MAG TPA: hypothetical protein VM242_00485 [Acidimicrobiales bacterium]|jgi:hypothetical protein|nr:hypothetical protein [Acidimicrobiales bacterium]